LEEATPETEIWPDNARAVDVFVAMSTQWRIGAVGAVGLDYNVLPLVLQMLDIPTSERNDLFESLRVMEESALTTMRNRRNQ
jgi:hypothetical protein